MSIQLHTKDLAVGYRIKRRDVLIIDHLNVQLMAGKLVCFMGPNGVGKSTLLRTLCGVQRPLRGGVFIQDKAIESIQKDVLARKISVVLTDPVYIGNITVRELVSFGRYPYTGWNMNFSPEDARIIDRAIKETQLQPIADTKLAELSDGQRQKALIARALCQDTDIIILDEPTAHLDLNNRVEIINLLKHLSRQTGKAIVMATHELDLALQTADELWIVGFDKKLQVGFPEDLVLNGKVDHVFQLKGFDLRTGHLEKRKSKRNVSLTGESEGHYLLWTKNALERNGYGIDPENDFTIETMVTSDKAYWKINEGVTLDSLEKLIQYLDQL
ncbi:ABC transporter ATP-binding protein [Fulvivirga sp. M361]|uniref:ABC transporter ATP-binding protein n=1 Tax=Fulvivirga sp. M361 TaxID=2594266 RepID=UPI00117A9200|nr:ABC transporter ATP-binding protein [Fulvivirga sp. M361]TRX55536.1 ABC transporter ATP-binding protein [Fulvivirga sp. M361]